MFQVWPKNLVYLTLTSANRNLKRLSQTIELNDLAKWLSQTISDQKMPDSSFLSHHFGQMIQWIYPTNLVCPKKVNPIA